MLVRTALFVGMYPNPVSPYRNIFFQNIIFALADKGVDCTVISPVPITKYGKSILNIPRETFHISPSGERIKVYYPRYISASSKQIGKYNTEKLSENLFEESVMRQLKKVSRSFDFVYGHFFLYGGLAAVKVGQYLKIPSFIAYGECDFDSQVKQTYGVPSQKQLKSLTGIISVSSKNTNELKSLNMVPTVPILTAPNSTDLSLFYPREKTKCREQLGIPKDIFVVGFVGGFISRKGDKRLLKAVNQLEDVYVAYAGRGDDPPVGEKVIFCETLDHEMVSVFLNTLDIFVLPTLSEGSCNAIVEAMACGIPIISSDLPFNDDALDSNNSIRINPNSIESIKKAITKLKNNDELRLKLKQNALDKSQSFEIGNRAAKILSFIEECREAYI